jgi:hypothetical protein
LLSRHPTEPEVWHSVSKKGRSGYRHGTASPRCLDSPGQES